jgi:hypothetical protein
VQDQNSSAALLMPRTQSVFEPTNQEVVSSSIKNTAEVNVKSCREK